MKIQQTSTLTFAKRLVPISEYKGPILKLTKSDNAKISKLSADIMDLEAERSKIENIAGKPTPTNRRYYQYEGILQKIEAKIQDLKNSILEIKKNRLRKQCK